MVDPGCYTKKEQLELSTFITEHKLKPVYLLNTHCHIDHVLGNKYVAETYNLPFLMPEGEQIVLDEVVNYAPSMGINYQKSPDADIFVKEDSIGRTDLPGGNYTTLMESIKNKLLPLADDVKVYAGHMQSTTIGRERKMNPFLNE